MDLGRDCDMRQALGWVDPLQQPPSVTQGGRELVLEDFLDKHRQPMSLVGALDRQCNEHRTLFVERNGRIPAFLVQHKRMADDRLGRALGGIEDAVLPKQGCLKQCVG